MHVFREVPLTAGSNYSTARVLRQPAVTSAVISALIRGSSVTPAINTHTFILKDIVFNQMQRASCGPLQLIDFTSASAATLVPLSHAQAHVQQALPCVGIFFSPSFFFFFLFFALCAVVYQNKETRFG